MVRCDRGLKERIVRSGLEAQTRRGGALPLEPIAAIAAVGDPMQPVVAGMVLGAIGAGLPVLLAGGTQMLAVWELARRLALLGGFPWAGDRVVVGTTRWVVEDERAKTLGGAVRLARSLGAPLLASQLDLSNSRHGTLRMYEQGYVKEGVGAGGAAIGAVLHRGWDSAHMVRVIDRLADEL
jgi:NaMN:DMB phosphoribosyltransferase